MRPLQRSAWPETARILSDPLSARRLAQKPRTILFMRLWMREHFQRIPTKASGIASI
jgi:hypothetical protein